MNEILISIIIPVYNAEKYLRNTLENILSQITSKVEVIIIDDGSKDKSSIIYKSYSYILNFSYYYQVNSGAPAARNKGLNESRGKYVFFFDADDRMHPGLIDYLIGLVEKDDFDTIVGNYYRINDNTQKSEFGNPQKYRSEFQKYMMDPFPGCRIYRKQVLIENNIYFENVKIGQDLNFLGIATRILIVDRYFADYIYNKDSISRSIDERILDIGNSIFLCDEFYIKRGIEERKRQFMLCEGLKHVNYQMEKIRYIDRYDKAKRFFDEIKNIRTRIISRTKIIINTEYLIKRIIVWAVYIIYASRITYHIWKLRKG